MDLPRWRRGGALRLSSGAQRLSLCTLRLSFCAVLALAGCVKPPAHVWPWPAGADPLPATLSAASCDQQLAAPVWGDPGGGARPQWSEGRRCTVKVPALSLEFDQFSPVDSDTFVMAQQGAEAISVLTYRRSAGVAWVIGTIPADPGRERQLSDVRVLPGSPYAIVLTVRADRIEVWTLPMTGGPLRASQEYAGSVGVWPMGDGGYLVLDGARILQVNDGAPRTLAEEVMGAELINASTLVLHTLGGARLISLADGALRPAQALPEGRVATRIQAGGALVYAVPSERASESCEQPNKELYRLPAPYTGPAEKLMEGVAQVSWDQDSSLNLVVHPRPSSLFLVAADIEGRGPGEGGSRPVCPEDLGRSAPRSVEAELFKLPAAGGAVQALGCGTNRWGFAFEPGCIDFAALQAQRPPVTVPAAGSCLTLDEAADLCFGALKTGEPEALRACMGGDPAPDHGSASIVAYAALINLRMLVLAQLEKPVTRTIEQDGDRAMVRTQVEGEQDLMLVFEKEDCTWRMAGRR